VVYKIDTEGIYRDKVLERIQLQIELNSCSFDALCWLLFLRDKVLSKDPSKFFLSRANKLELNHIEKYQRRRKNKRPDR